MPKKRSNFEDGFNNQEFTLLEGNIKIHPNATIGSNSSIGKNTKIFNCTLATVNIGKDCIIGNYSILEDGVKVEDGSKIWHYCHIRNDVTIGKDCNLGDYVFIDSGVVIGDGTKVQNYVPIYHGVTLEEGVFFGPNSLTTNDMIPRARTPDGEIKSGDDWEVGHIHIGKDVSIGAGAVLRPGIRIGEMALIGAGAVVVKDVPPGAVVVGNPGKIIKYIDGYKPK